MYQLFYGLSEKPFSQLPDPRFLYSGRSHSMAYTMLEYGVLSRAPLTVITGGVGSGKTTLLRHLLYRLDCTVTVGLINTTNQVADQLLRWILWAFRQDYKSTDTVELYNAFEAFLITGYAAGRRAVLFVDEAQNLTYRTLEALRLLGNINVDKDLLLQIVLVGQTPLKEKLERPALQAFTQRVAVSYHLGTLSEPDTIAYIHHRLSCAGGIPTLFSSAACSEIHAYSAGVPRVINALCDAALVYGYADAAPEIGLNVVHAVINDRSRGIQYSHGGIPEEPCN